MAAWRRCIPAARAVNVRELLPDAEVALLEGVRALSLGRVAAASKAALARLVPGRLRELRLYGAARSDARLAELCLATPGVTVVRAYDSSAAAIRADCAAVLRLSLVAGNARDQLASARIVRTRLQHGHAAIGAIADAGCVRLFARLLRSDEVRLQLSGAAALMEIAAGAPAHAASVVKAGAARLIELLSLRSATVRKQALL